MNQVLLSVYAVGERMPDADTDVLIFDGPGPVQLGAYVGTSDDGAQLWVDAQGGAVEGVTHWAELPAMAAEVAEHRPDECTRLRGQRMVLLELLGDAADVINNLPDEAETQDEADMLTALKNRIAHARSAVLRELQNA